MSQSDDPQFESTTRVALARYAHDTAWSGWMRYMFSTGDFSENGTWIMPPEKVERWRRLMDTSYDALTDAERKSDLEQADHILAVISTMYEGETP